MLGTGDQAVMNAYADIHNNGEQSIRIKGVEFITGNIHLYETDVGISQLAYTTGTSYTRLLDEKASGTHVYQLSLPSPIKLSPHSTKSVKFLEADVKVTPFLYYTTVFSSGNSHGKLFNAYNLTCFNNFLPTGRLLLREEGRFIGQINLPDLTRGETYTTILGYDADVLYRRQVTILEGDQNSDSITYHVEYIFENYKPSRDVRVYFIESFESVINFEIRNISTSKDDKKLPDLVSNGKDLRGYITIPHQRRQKIISYDIITRKTKPEVVAEDDE